jgi:glucosamine--fructose-6-phosphate aminotransferase (isomerizing)
VNVFRITETRRELLEQPARLQETLDAMQSDCKEIAQDLAERHTRQIYAVGCGDSYLVAWSVAWAWSHMLGLPFHVLQALEYARYYHSFSDPHDAVIIISSSGQGDAVLSALDQARRMGCYTLGVTNTAGRPLTTDTSAHLLIRATRVGWPTQASTAAIGALTWLACVLVHISGWGDGARAAALREELTGMPDRMQCTLEQHDQRMQEIAAALRACPDFFFVGAGPSFGSAGFGAAKVKELSEDHATAMLLEEFHHYDTVKAGEPLFVVDPQGRAYQRAVQTAQAAAKANARVIALVPDGEERVARLAAWPILLPPVSEELSALVYPLPLHLFAQHLATHKIQRGTE